jgi:DNA polymerase III alpha subunit (gram-positive type)
MITPKFNQILAVDVETTGLASQYDYITQLGMAIMDRDSQLQTFETDIQPNLSKAKISLEALAVQAGDITTDEGLEKVIEWLKKIRVAPTAKDAAVKVSAWLQEFYNGEPLVAQNAVFDDGFLTQFFFQQRAALDIVKLSPVTICTKKYARRVIPGMKSYSLDPVRERLGLSVREGVHTALDDAIRAGEVFFKLQDLEGDI